MIKIGLVGEDPNDTKSIQNLLLKKYSGRVKFKFLIKGLKGYQLDNPKIKRSLPIEVSDTQCSVVLFIRDTDGFPSQSIKVAKVKNWFNELSKLIGVKAVLLNNTWELEALIFSDIDTFNKIFKTNVKNTRDPMLIKEPKEELKRVSRYGKRQYSESDCPEIFSKLNFDTVQSNCNYFREFIKVFDKMVK